jgi:protein-L-isoaspartate O-methyltransferase
MFLQKIANRLILCVLCELVVAVVVAQPVRPYQCGFVLESKAEILEVYGPELAALDLHAGEVIADIGGSNGYRMGMFATLQDSLHIYVQDIDTLCLNARELLAVQQYYARVNGQALHSTFEMVVGDTLATHLPTAAIDKIFVTVAYHHFGNPTAMMADISSKLRPGGKIFLIENVVRQDGKRRRRLCDDPLKTTESLQLAFENQGLNVLEIHRLGRWWTKLFVLQPRQ